MKAYSFLNTVVLVGAPPIIPPASVSHWSDGDDALQIKRLNDSMSHRVGADGKMALAISADRSGSFVMKLLQTSPTNKILQDICNLQQNGPAGFAPCTVLFQDTYRQDRGGAAAGYVLKPADLTRGMGVNEVEWTIIVERLDILLGNPTFAGFPSAAAESL